MSDFLPDSTMVERVVASPNHDERKARADLILLHYTGMEVAREALERLCDPKARVSCHYFVYENGGIAQLVPEALRAWHAGVSSWLGETDINSRSIGIEIVNGGHEFGYPDFPKRQIAAVITLCRSIVRRHQVRADLVLAHSDVAPSRKQDPGEKFPWHQLAASGIGLWVDPAPITASRSMEPGHTGDAVANLQRALGLYGYGVEVTAEYDKATQEVVTAFQRHFRPARVDGLADTSTLDTLRRLLMARGKLIERTNQPAAS